MPSFRIGQAAEMLGVSADTLRRWAEDGRVKTTRSKGNQRLVDGREIARLMRSPPEPPAPEVIAGRSARNRFPGIVTRVLKDKVAAQVEIQAGPHRVVSLLTREAVDELGLRPGMVAIAAVKATNVVIEVPGK